MLRDDSGQNLRDYLIATAARLIDERGSAGLAVRDIAREAKVADGVLYNYFEDKEDLIVHALLAHVGTVMSSAPQLLPPPGEGTVAENLRAFIDGGIATLRRVTPAFVGLLAEPRVLARFHAMVGGDAAFDPASAEGSEAAAEGGEAAGPGVAAAADRGADTAADGGADAAADGGVDTAADGGAGAAGQAPGRDSGTGVTDGRGLPDLLTSYLRGEQRLGRVGAGVDIDAAAALIVGAMHGQIVPRVLFTPPGSPITIPPGLGARLADVVLDGIAPGAERRSPPDVGA